MKIRFISDLHYYLNLSTSEKGFIDILNKKEPADVTLIAGDLNCTVEEAHTFFNRYFFNEKVVFIAGNHTTCVYTPGNEKTVQEVISKHNSTFNKDNFDGKWIFLENEYIQLSENIYCIGCCGWTNFEYGHQTKSDYIKQIEKEKAYRESHKETDSLMGDGKKVPIHYMGILPDDPAKEYDELDMGNKDSYRGRRMKDAVRYMNDYNYGKVIRNNQVDYLRPIDTYNMHQESLKQIKKCYNEIVSKNPNAIIILMTHHPFTTKCISKRYKDDVLTSAFVSDHNRWLKQFKNIKYITCGHVHQRFFDKLGDKQIICNPCGYLFNYEHIQDIPFNINYILNVKEK